MPTLRVFLNMRGLGRAFGAGGLATGHKTHWCDVRASDFLTQLRHRNLISGCIMSDLVHERTNQKQPPTRDTL